MGKKRVLVIEDNPKQNELICRIVERTGYIAISAYNGLEGFDRLREYRRGLGFIRNKINCILLDLNMDKMSGLEFLDILRREERWTHFQKRIPVVVLTAHDLDTNRMAAENPYFGLASEFLVKPFDELELQDTLIKILELNDSQTMAEMSCRRTPETSSNEEQLLKIRAAFFQGKNNADTRNYAMQRLKEAEADYAAAEKSPLDDAHKDQFKLIRDLFADQYQRINSAAESV